MRRIVAVLLLTLTSQPVLREQKEPCSGDLRIWARVQPDAFWEPGDGSPPGDGGVEGDALEIDGCGSADDEAPSPDVPLEVRQAFQEPDRWLRHRESLENNRFGRPRLAPSIEASGP